MRDAVLVLSHSSFSFGCAECAVMNTQPLLRSPQASCFIAPPRHLLDSAYAFRRHKREPLYPEAAWGTAHNPSTKRPVTMKPCMHLVQASQCVAAHNISNHQLVCRLACLLDRNSYLPLKKRKHTKTCVCTLRCVRLTMQGHATSQAQSTTAMLGLVPVMEGQLSPSTKICEYH